MQTKYWSESLNGREHLEDLGKDGRILRIDFRTVTWDVVEWIQLVLGRGKWWVLLNMVMNLWVQ
jgi:hypothetical protein